MAQWEDYSGDEWLRPSSARETRLKVDEGQGTRGVVKRPRLEKPRWGSGDTVAGFELIEPIGCGSHGWVYSAHEIATGRRMAIKIFPTVDQKEAVRAKTGFRRMSKLRHRGLVRLHRIHQEENWLAFSMEEIVGCNLVIALRKWRSLPLEEACERLLEMIRQVGGALAWMHAHQLVHRDIKPTNLMMTRDGKRFVIVDCDLTGKFEDESNPENIRTYLIWTPMYVAPEVLFRQSYCPASDIFSLGMVALEAMRMFSANAVPKNGETGSIPDPQTPQKVDSNEVTGEEIKRDEKSLVTDREHIVGAMTGLNEAIPELLRDTVNEMLSPDVSDRPTAMSLSRLGQSLTSRRPMIGVSTDTSARAIRITKASRKDELSEIQRWCHLVLGGQVQRLHIEGASGIGKSTLLELAIAELRKQSWANVYTARCQRFEQSPLQAFGQLADEIVMDFRRGQMGRLRVDSVSESILQRSLPGFNEVLEVDWSEPPVVTSPTRPGGRDAAMKVCNQLRRIGPLFFIIDDVQWADHDTVHVLDHLQSTVDHRIGPPQFQGMGLITISRTDGDQQQQDAHTKIKLGPLSPEVTTEAIRSEAEFQRVNLSESQVASLSDQIEGLPYRLDVYLSELSPSGLLRGQPDELLPRTPTIEEVWQFRSDLLGDDERRLLEYLVIAGRQLTFDELRLIDQHDNPALLETQLDELSEKRLIVRDGADGQYLRIWHDQLGRQLLHQIPENERIKIHRHWAEALSSEATEQSVIASLPNDGAPPKVPDSPRNHSPRETFRAAGRIAEHFEKAGQKEAFVHWARLAAGEAQNLYANIETARWYRAVAENTTGDEKSEALRMTAEMLERGGRLSDAAQVYQELLVRQSGQAKLEMELARVHCLIRSGRFAEVVEQLKPLLRRLELPSKKPVWLTKLSIVRRVLTQKVMRQAQRFQSVKSRERTPLESNQISACLRLIRPLSYIDNWLSTELCVFSGDLINQVGTDGEQTESNVGECVFNAYQAGRSQQQSFAILKNMREELSEVVAPARHGDVYAGSAWVHGMAGLLSEVPQYIRMARETYSASEIYHGFEVAHASLIEAIVYFQLGDFPSLASMVDDMQAESATTNDRFILAMGTLGHASAGFLGRDDVAGLQNLHKILEEHLGELDIEAFAMITPTKNLMLAIYQNRISELATSVLRIKIECTQTVWYRRVQIMRVMIDELLALSMLPLLANPPRGWLRRFKHRIRILRAQKIDYAVTKADLMEGLALARYPGTFASNPQTARLRAIKLLNQARDAAQSQGLVPAAMVAADELDRLNGIEEPSRLITMLTEQGIRDPAAYARLYGG
ncbi:serine/threonine-protein kinase [Neorhodopirellula lusitana]|uniref:serine/threonine-protein kinase n=1 Tax=Neorhodopirellula lusitana TaxID=445327 RepID=UPI00384BF38E